MAGGRPGLPVGTYGEINVTEDGGRYKARARYRDRDGNVRTVARFGQTKRAARDRLRSALADRQRDTGTGIRSGSTVAALARLWLAEEVGASTRAVNTKETYGYAVERYVVPAIGAVRVAEATTALCDEALVSVRQRHGPGAAKTTRSVLNGMFGLAIRHDALTINPVRETRSQPRPRPMSRSLSVTEVDDITDRSRCDERAVLLDLPDLIDFGMATGCRIGEALAVRESVLDLDAGTVEINATAIRMKGVGMVVQERPKTAAGWRVLALPSYAVAMLRRRRDEVRFNPPEVLVLDPAGNLRREPVWVAFPAPLARTLRDPSNTARDLRAMLDGFGYDWVHFHTFRKTVATRMDEAGCTGREIADQLGHSHPSMTQDNYMGRRVVSARAASVLDR